MYDLGEHMRERSVGRLKMALARGLNGAHCPACRFPLVTCKEHRGCTLLVCRCPGARFDQYRHHRPPENMARNRSIFLATWRALPRTQRQLLLQRIQGRRLEDVAQDMGISVSGAWQSEHRALQRLGVA